MARLKGCIAEECISCKKKKKYKEKDSYCVNCGGELSLICKKCRVVLDKDAQDKLCPDCAEAARVKNEKRVKLAGKALVLGAGSAIVLVTAFPKLKNVSALSKKLKKKKK